MTILDLVRILRTNLKTLVIAAVLGALLAAAYTATRPVLYATSVQAQVLAGSSQDTGSAMASQQLATSKASSYAQLAGGPRVAQRIVELSRGKLQPGDATVSAATVEGSATLTITAVSADPAKAQIAANAASEAVGAEAKYIETLGDVKSTIYSVYQLTSASKPDAPFAPKWPRNIAMGALAGLLAGICLVVLRKQLDSRIRHTNEVEKVTGVGVLGVIPMAKSLQNTNRGGLGSLGTTSEAFRMLRTNLRYVSAEHPPRSLVITSAVQGEGKSTVAANLARVLAAAGQRVALIDTDLRRPVVHETFELDNSVGLTEVLTAQARLTDALQQGDHKNLFIITSGRIPPNPSELLGSRRMSGVIDALSDDYFVLLDAPPLLPVTDGGLLAVAADGAAVVYHRGKTHREQVALCTKILEQVGANNFGSILNMTPTKEMGSTIYGYGAGNYGASGYGYGYGHTDEAAEVDALTPASDMSDLVLAEPSRVVSRSGSGATSAGPPRTEPVGARRSARMRRNEPDGPGAPSVSSEVPAEAQTRSMAQDTGVQSRSASGDHEAPAGEVSRPDASFASTPPSRRSRRLRANDDA